MSLSKRAILEVQQLSTEAEYLAKGSATQRARASVLLQRISTIRQIGLSTDEVRKLYTEALIEDVAPRQTSDAEYRGLFDKYVFGRIGDQEVRDFLAGQMSITAPEGPAGGFTVPFGPPDATLRTAMSQTDPIFDDKVVDFTMNDGAFLQPCQVSGFDLSSIAATVVGETVLQDPGAIPAVSGSTLRSDITWRVSFAASIESEKDVPDFSSKIVAAAGVALARGAGRSIISGRGGSDVTGITTALGAPTVSNQTPGKLVLTDFLNFYFAINRFYRAAAKAGWLVSDGAYKMIRAAVDVSGRPLLNIENDREILLGRPLYVSPSLATAYSSIGLTGAVLFGDLSHVVVRVSRPTIQRSIEQSQRGIEFGEALWISRMRGDATLFDPSSGANPPLVLAAIS